MTAKKKTTKAKQERDDEVQESSDTKATHNVKVEAGNFKMTGISVTINKVDKGGNTKQLRQVIKDKKKKGYEVVDVKVIPGGGMKVDFAPTHARPKTSKHHIEQRLEAAKQSEQLDIFDILFEDTRQSVERLNITRELINEKGAGIELTSSEAGLIDVLVELLNEKSPNTKDKGAKDYFAGNMGLKPVAIFAEGERYTQHAPRFGVRPLEIAQRYADNPRPGGKTVRDVLSIIDRLANDRSKFALLRYSVARDIVVDKEKIRRTLFLEQYKPLIEIAYAGVIDENEQGDVVNVNREMIITMHPVFRESMHLVTIPRPRRAEVVRANNGSVTQTRIARNLIDELCIAQSNRSKYAADDDGNRLYQITRKLLFNKIAGHYLPPNKSRPKKLHKEFDEAVEMNIRLGIIKEMRTREGSADEVLIFVLDNTWARR